jgi:hypothetical protein
MSGRSGDDAVAAISQAPLVLLSVGVGLAVQAGGDALARYGHETPALPMFFTGLLVIFVPCAWRLVDARAGRRERLQVSTILGIGLLASYVLRSPLILDQFDELLHGATLMDLLGTRALFTPNTALPVSPYYPGLELLTISVKWLTGLPLDACQVIVLVVARVMLVLGVFLVVERLCGSARAGGLGVLVYSASPQFYSFNAQFAYQTLALGLAVVTVHLLLAEIDGAPGPRGRLALAVACVVAVVVTHHVVGWVTVATLVVWAGVLAGRPGRAGARTVGTVAVAGLVAASAWTAFVGHRLLVYLVPLFSSAISGLADTFVGLHAGRALFSDASGAPSPPWEIAVMLVAAAAWCVLLLVALRAHVRQSATGVRWERLVPVAIAACYPLTLLAHLTSPSAEIGDRASTFVFFAVALVVAGWYAARPATAARRGESPLAVGLATLCFLGGMLLGSGPTWSYVPGPFLVGADQRSIGSPSLAAALWAGAHLPAGSRIAADRDNGALLDDIGQDEPVTAIGGLVNVGPLYFSDQFGAFQLSLVRKAKIRYLLVDDRLAEGAPRFGVYFEPGETATPQRLTSEELHKFASVTGARLIYDNGVIQIYDLASLLGLSPEAPVPPGRGQSGTGTDWVVLGAAVVVAVAWARRLRKSAPPDAGAVLSALGLIAVAGIVIGFVFVPSGLPPRGLGVAALAVLGAGSFWRSERRPAAQAAARRPMRWPARAVAGAALGAGAVVLATVAARQDWRPPPELALQYVAARRAVAEVQLGTADDSQAVLEVQSKGKVVDRVPLATKAVAQIVQLPQQVETDGATVVLVLDGRPALEVQG